MTQEMRETRDPFIDEVNQETIEHLSQQFTAEIVRMAESIPGDSGELAILAEVQERLNHHLVVAYQLGHERGFQSARGNY